MDLERGRGRPSHAEIARRRAEDEARIQAYENKNPLPERREAVVSTGQMLVRSRFNGEIYHVTFPMSWTPQQALAAAEHYIATRGVRAWEEIELP